MQADLSTAWGWGDRATPSTVTLPETCGERVPQGGSGVSWGTGVGRGCQTGSLNTEDGEKARGPAPRLERECFVRLHGFV